MGFIKDLEWEWEQTDKPYLLLWMFVWLLETNLFFYISSRRPEYFTLDYIVVYILVGLITSAIVKLLNKLIS
jgi:hypothetical protein